MRISILAFLTIVFAHAGAAHAAPLKLDDFRLRPKLVVLVVIDQFRSDFLTRFEERLRSNKSGGLSYLTKHGAYFPFAKYDVLQSMTCPGHATLLTGAYPYQMGIPVNEWYDSSKKVDVYCAEDGDGVNPKRLKGSTVGDELKLAGFKSKIVSIALKDRAAVMMGGHLADLALWNDGGPWTSSKYYLKGKPLPAWVASINSEIEKNKGSKFKWTAGGKPSGLTIAESNASQETIAGSRESFGSPYGVDLTTNLAIRALREMKLGKSVGPDLLLVSYSSHDILGHEKGLASAAMEELTLLEDASIGRLVTAVDAQVGLKNVVFVFTGDHGVAPAVEDSKSQGMPAGFLDSQGLKAEAEVFFEKKWGKSGKGPWLLRAKNLAFYFNPEVLAEKNKSRADAESELKKLVLSENAAGEIKRDGIAHVFTRTEWNEHRLPPGRYERQIRKTFISGVSGDVVMIPKPFWVEKTAFATHVTGYNYDRSVPLIISGPHVKPGVYPNEVELTDLAPTLSFILGIVAPSGSDGRVLHEIF